MRRMLGLFLILCLFVVFFSACDTSVPVADGVYRVEMSEYDENGYKDYVEFAVSGGKVTSIIANAYHLDDGKLKTESHDIKVAMEKFSGTYPEKFYKDLVNGYIGSGGTTTDVIAGATVSSENFYKMMELAKNAAITGDTSIRIVESD